MASANERGSECVSECVSEGVRVASSRRRLGKGFVLRKRCGQIKPQEMYLHPDPLLTLGSAPLTQAELSACVHTCGSGTSGSGARVLVPTLDCLLFFSKLLLEASVHVHSHLTVVFLQTILRSTLETAAHSTRKELQEILQNSLTLKPLVFLNEVCEHTAIRRRDILHESTHMYILRQVNVALSYLRTHLHIMGDTSTKAPPGLSSEESNRTTMHILAADEQDGAWWQQQHSTTPGVGVTTMHQFIASICGERSSGTAPLHSLWELFDSCAATRQCTQQASPLMDKFSSSRIHFALPGFAPYIPPSEVRRGLQSGSLMSGELNVFPYCTQEAEVLFNRSLPVAVPDDARSGSVSNSNTTVISSCLILGMGHRNRAFQGDTVVIEMLPYSEWKVSSTSLNIQDESEDVQENEVEEGVTPNNTLDSDFYLPQPKSNFVASSMPVIRLPTGRVVAIIKRSTVSNEIVAAFPSTIQSTFSNGGIKEDGGSVTVDKRERSLLLVPLDRRLPKIRVKTRNWVALGGRRVVVALDAWDLYSKYPSGHLIQYLPAHDSGGDGADLTADVGAMLLKNSIFPRPFSLEAMSCLPDMSHIKHDKDTREATANDNDSDGTWKDSHWKIPPGGMHHRKDLRNATVVELAALAATASSLTMPTTQSSESPTSSSRPLWSTIATSFDDGTGNVVEPTVTAGISNEKMRIFSVDPKGCQDIDDAMSITPLPVSDTTLPGTFLLGIHIADVTSFIPEGCALDIEARSRATTVYLPNQRLDMLPALLASDVASLHAGNRERYAMTIFFTVRIFRKSTGLAVDVGQGAGAGARLRDTLLELDGADDLEVDIPLLPCWAGHTALCSTAAMTYDQAHNLIHALPPDDKDKAPVKPGVAGAVLDKSLWDPVTGDLAVLTVISRALTRKRKGTGALDLELSEGGQLKFGLDPSTGLPCTVVGSKPLEIHNTIAELMILANGSVARLIYQCMPTATLLRSHGVASLDKLNEIEVLGSSMGLSLFDNSDGSGPPSDKEVMHETSTSNFISQGHQDTEQRMHRQLREYKKIVQGFSRQQRKLTGAARGNASAAVDFITSMVIRAMDEAKYVCSESSSSGGAAGISASASEVGDPGKQFEHFGLGLRFYTHYTSPIRRYADIIVHRQLVLVLQLIAHQRQHVKLGTSSTVLHGITEESLNFSSGSENLPKLPPSSVISLLDRTRAVTNEVPSYVPDQLIGAEVSENNKEEEGEGDELLDFLDDVLDGVSDSLILQSPGKDSAIDVPITSMGDDDNNDNDDENGDEFLDNVLGEVTDELLPNSVTQQNVDEGGSDENFLDDILDVVTEDALSNTVARQDLIANCADTIEGERQPVMSQSSPITNGETEVEVKRSTTYSTPLLYPPAQLARIANHLNVMNRRSKRVQVEAQELFLRHYFARTCEVHHALVYSLRDNGFLAFLPAFQFKGPVYLTNAKGVVRGHSQLFSDAGGNKWRIGLPLKGSEVETIDYPEYSCVLQNANSETELVISRRGDEQGQYKDKTLRLHHMQRVLVAVTALPLPSSSESNSSSSRMCSVPELRMALLSTEIDNVETVATSEAKETKVMKKKQSVSASPTNVKSQHQTESSKHKKKCINSLEDKSFYTVLNSFKTCGEGQPEKKEVSDVISSILSKTTKIRTSRQFQDGGNISAKQYRDDVVGRRWEVPSTGRVCFLEPVHDDPSSENTSFRASSIFRTKGRMVVDHKGRGSKIGGKALGANGSSIDEINFDRERESGRGLAMHRMQQWGEEWAEEEDLPSSYSESNEQEGPGGGTNGPLTSDIQKQVAQATARQHKLKIAKRNSKY